MLQCKSCTLNVGSMFGCCAWMLIYIGASLLSFCSSIYEWTGIAVWYMVEIESCNRYCTCMQLHVQASQEIFKHNGQASFTSCSCRCSFCWADILKAEGVIWPQSYHFFEALKDVACVKHVVLDCEVATVHGLHLLNHQPVKFRMPVVAKCLSMRHINVWPWPALVRS